MPNNKWKLIVVNIILYKVYECDPKVIFKWAFLKMGLSMMHVNDMCIKERITECRIYVV